MPPGRAMPKSATLKISSLPNPQQSTLFGLRSRCTTPTSWMATSPCERQATAFAARSGSNAEPVARRLAITRSSSVVPSTPPCTYSSAVHGSCSACAPSCTCTVPVSTSRTTNGVGGVRSLSRASDTASLRTLSAAIPPSSRAIAGRRTLITTVVCPSNANRVAPKATLIPPPPSRRSSTNVTPGWLSEGRTAPWRATRALSWGGTWNIGAGAYPSRRPRLLLAQAAGRRDL